MCWTTFLNAWRRANIGLSNEKKGKQTHVRGNKREKDYVFVVKAVCKSKASVEVQKYQMSTYLHKTSCKFYNIMLMVTDAAFICFI